MTAGRAGLLTIGDLWCWDQEAWRLEAKICSTFGVNAGVARLVAQSPTCSLALEFQEAMSTATQIQKGMWVTLETIFASAEPTTRLETWYVSAVIEEQADLRKYIVTNDLGWLAEDRGAALVSLLTHQLTPIFVLVKGPKRKWLADWESTAALDETVKQRVWYGCKANSQLAIALEDWRCQSTYGNSAWYSLEPLNSLHYTHSPCPQRIT